MRKSYSKLGWIGLSVLLVFLIAQPAAAGAPTDQTRTTVDKVLEILNNAELRAEGKKTERREQLRAVISARFDFAEMARRSLAAHWSRRSARERQQFMKVFADLLENSYLEKLESYNGEKIAYLRETQDNDRAEVFTKVVTKKGEEFSVNYALHPINGEWKVYDVVIENISLVNNYRSQFNRVLAKDSFDELLRRLRGKSPEFKPVKG
jgi:phospholipid transport system substrate-binding protein